jgi:hypothetical protein
MGSIGFQVAALYDGLASQAAENAQAAQAMSDVPAANEIPAGSSPKAQRDTVSLSGTLRPQPGRQNAPSRSNAQPATFTLLAHTITFPPDQNSTAAFTTAAFPPEATPSAGQNQPPAVIATSAPNAAAANVIATSGAQTTAGTQSPSATATAPATATASPTNAPSTAPPQQTLKRLDRMLQQLGIDPQRLSRISREGMLNWVNDPAALRQIVQNVQSAAHSSQEKAAAGVANPALRIEQLFVAGANQNQIPSQTQNQPQASVQDADPASGSSSAASSANTNALNQSAATTQQNATAVVQFQKLQDSLAPGGTTETWPAASPGSTTPQGQILNLSA